LETNVFSNERLGGHGSVPTVQALLPTFLEALPNLKGIIAHGAVAATYARSISLPEGIRLDCLRHFRSESYAKLDEVAKRLM
jgi:hypothetical protein